MNFAKTKHRILQFLEKENITVSEFLKKTGIKRGFLDGDKLNSAVSDSFLSMIVASYPHLNIYWLITGEGAMLKSENIKKYDILEPQIQRVVEPQVSVYKLRTDYYGVERQEIPLYEIEASAGLSTLFSNQAQQIPLDHIVLPNAPKCDGAMYIRGDSMYPLLKAGDIACYKVINNFDNVIFGEKYILDICNDDDDYLTVKYVQKSEKGADFLTLVSENKYHSDRDVHKSTIRALAMVKITVRFETLA